MRVRLLVDLTSYDPRCTAGSEGETCWASNGGSDLLTGVMFDSGARLDVFSTGLEIIDEEYLRQNAERELEEARTARDVVLLTGPRGGYRYLSYQHSNGHISYGTACGTKLIRRKLDLLERAGVPVRVEVEGRA